MMDGALRDSLTPRAHARVTVAGRTDTVAHDPPLVVDMSTDRNETTPLTPATLPSFDAEVAAVRAALAAHYDTVAPAKDQMISVPIAPLNPCCDGVWPTGKCTCQRYDPSGHYP